jgi:hypothetical protein
MGKSSRPQREDNPKITASCILKENVSRSKSLDQTQSSAKKVIRDLRRLVRRISRPHDHFLNNNDQVYKVQQIMNWKK